VAFRLIAGVLGAPLIAAAPFLILAPVAHFGILLTAYLTALIAGAIAFVILGVAGWHALRAFVAAGVVVSLAILALLPTLHALVVYGSWQMPSLLPGAPVLFVMLLCLAGAAAGAFVWWLVEPYMWASTDEMIRGADD
jgi:hypothetical protein